MCKNRFSEELIIGMLREHEAWVATVGLGRTYALLSATSHKYKAMFGRMFGEMTVFDAQRLRTLQGDNGKLKKLLAEAMRDNAVLKDLASENV